jgi:hypothetical protein
MHAREGNEGNRETRHKNWREEDWVEEYELQGVWIPEERVDYVKT